jgi:glutaminyl-peptide cyclotransferase
MPKVYTFNIINEYPHDMTSYTQGLEFYKGELYESTGQHGESKLRKLDFKTAEVKNNIDLSDEFFGEGLTVLNDNIYQLTWQQGVGFVYDVNTFERKSSFKYGLSKEGWGLCNDSEVIYKSDGTENIWILDPATLIEKEHIQAYTNKGKIVGLNELEWIDGKIYANRYQKNGVAIINPKNGAIEAVIDFSSLIKKVKQHPKLDVLNGIAFNPETKTIFVTGKNWDKLFEVEIIEK